MIFSENQLFLTTGITFTIRKIIESAFTAITKRTRLLFFIYISKNMRKSDGGNSENGGIMINISRDLTPPMRATMKYICE